MMMDDDDDERAAQVALTVERTGMANSSDSNTVVAICENRRFDAAAEGSPVYQSRATHDSTPTCCQVRDWHRLYVPHVADFGIELTNFRHPVEQPGELAAAQRWQRSLELPPPPLDAPRAIALHVGRTERSEVRALQLDTTTSDHHARCAYLL